MNIAGFYPESISNGEGYRAVIFVSGCSHNCRGCQNKEAQDQNYGTLLDKEYRDKILKSISSNDNITGVTLSGGEPFEDYNIDVLCALIDDIKAVRPGLNIWSYSGFKYEILVKNDHKFKLLKRIDVLVDGLYIERLKDLNAKFKGSSNQRLISVKESIRSSTMVQHKLWGVLDKFKL